MTKNPEIRTRFAPSPTGYLHVGGARTTLYNWLFARHHGGTFVLRIEDTDEVRSTADSVSAILDSISWLGLDWDEGPMDFEREKGPHASYYQMKRLATYQEHTKRLLDAVSVGKRRFKAGGAMGFNRAVEPILQATHGIQQSAVHVEDNKVKSAFFFHINSRVVYIIEFFAKPPAWLCP